VRQLFPEADINAAIVPDRQSLVRDPFVEHMAFCDPSGGVSDSMTLAVAHLDTSRMVVLDRLEAVKPPFRPEDVCQRFADILSGYGLNTVTGDRYSAEWTVSAFRRVGVTYTESELTKSEIYLAAQPLFTQRRVELLDIPVLAGQLRRLERRARSGGKDAVDHPRGSHDDSANAAAGALVLASKWAGRSIDRALLDGRPLHVRSSVSDPFVSGSPRYQGGLSTDPWTRGLGKPASAE
jgi:hypothetical protein